MTIPITLDIYKGNPHPAKVEAKAIFRQLKKGKPITVAKDTGAGGTTGLGSSPIDTGEKFLLIEPLKSGASDVLRSCVQYCDAMTDAPDDATRFKLITDGLLTMAFPTNMDCPKVKEMIKKNPDLKEWYKYVVDCKECELKKNCPVYKSVQVTEEDEKVVGYGITYSGIIASMLSRYRDLQTRPEEPSLGTRRIEKILKCCTVLLIDECHLIEFGKTVSIKIFDVKDGMPTQYRSRFCGIMSTPDGEYPKLKALLSNIDELIADERTQDAILRCINQSTDKENGKRLLNVRIPNPFYIDTEDPKHFGHYVAVNNEMIYLHIDKRRPIERLSSIKNILDPLSQLMGNKSLDLELEWTNGRYVVNLVADNVDEREALEDFITESIKMGKKVVFITATKGRYNYDRYMPNGGHMPTVLLGEGGDPTDSAGEQLILADSYKMSGEGRNSFNAQLPCIREEILEILNQEGKGRVVIVARKAAEADAIRKMVAEELGWFHNTEHRKAENDLIVTYYRGPDSHSGRFYFYTWIGNWGGEDHWDKKPAKVMILVGGADTPGHCMDRFCKTREAARIMRQTEIFMQMFQMCGRIKGNGRSLVYCIGINLETVKNFTTWGTKYEMQIDENPTRPKITINVGKAISKPSIIGCKTLDERLARGRLYLNGFFGVIRIADIGKTEFFSENWNKILKKQIRQRKGFSPQFHVPQFRQLPRLPVSVKTVKLLPEVLEDSHSLLLYIKGIGVNIRDPNLILLETDTDIQILQVGKFQMRTPADVNNFKGSLYCGSIEIVKEVLEHYQGKRLKEIKRTQAENQLREICKQIRVAQRPVDVQDGLTFLKQVFGGCSTRYAVRTKTSHGWPYYTARDRKGKDKKLDDFALLGHMAGNHTILTYTIDDFDKVRHITFDVDAHEKEGSDTNETYLAKLEAARTKRNVIFGLLENMGMEPMLVKSGSMGSWHIVLACLPVSADKAHYFANCVMEAAGYPEARTDERFPKQPTCQIFYGRDEVPYDELEAVYIGRGGNIRKDLLGPTVDETPIENYMSYGNGTKIPFGADRKNGSWVYVYHPQAKRFCRYMVKAIGNGFDPVMYWVDESGNMLAYQSFPVRAIDISGIEVPKEAMPVPVKISTSEPSTVAMPMRRFFKWVVKQGNLVNTAGHFLRVALFYELAYRCMMTDAQILEVFRSMGLEDFTEEKTMENIKETRRVGGTIPYGPKKYQKLISPANWENYLADRPYVPDEYKPPE